MGLLDRFRRRRDDAPTTPLRGSARSDVDARAVAEQLTAFLAARPGTEAWIEEPAGINPASVLMIALDGESRRWSVPDVPWVADWCRKHRVVFHRAGVEPYPQRMRDYKARQRALAREVDGRP